MTSPTQQPKQKLLSCPFCGGDNVRIVTNMYADDDGEHDGVECINCDASNQLQHWNNRPFIEAKPTQHMRQKFEAWLINKGIDWYDINETDEDEFGDIYYIDEAASRAFTVWCNANLEGLLEDTFRPGYSLTNPTINKAKYLVDHGYRITGFVLTHKNANQKCSIDLGRVTWLGENNRA